jgi:hypothetical protein
MSSVEGEIRNKLHPLAHLILANDDLVHDESGLHSLYNTKGAIRAITTRGSPALQRWLSKSLEELSVGRDYENCSATLAEIRAAGYCTAIGLHVEHINETRACKTPDFSIIVPGGTELRVEVAAKQMDGKEAELLGKFRRSEFTATPARTFEGVTIREHSIQPAGAPRGNESSSAEVIIRKFSRIKQNSGQASTTLPSILWIDLQDQDWTFVSACDAEPVFLATFDCFWSTGFWHAFYGRLDMPIFMGHCVHPRPLEDVPRMIHHGMFMQDDSWSAIIMTLPQCTAVFQHPEARVTLPDAFLEGLHRLTRFDFSRSYFAWPSGCRDVRKRVEDTAIMLEALAKVAKHRLY